VGVAEVGSGPGGITDCRRHNPAVQRQPLDRQQPARQRQSGTATGHEGRTAGCSYAHQSADEGSDFRLVEDLTGIYKQRGGLLDLDAGGAGGRGAGAIIVVDEAQGEVESAAEGKERLAGGASGVGAELGDDGGGTLDLDGDADGTGGSGGTLIFVGFCVGGHSGDPGVECV